MFNVSDFRFPTVFLKRACKLRNCAFIDLPVVFNESITVPAYQEGALHVGVTEVLGDTLNRIISLYLRNFDIITGAQLFPEESKKNIDDICICLAGFFRMLSFSQDSLSKAKSDEAVAKRLGQEHFIWIALKDIICPSFNIPVAKNIKLVVSPSFCVDAALFVDDETYNKGSSDGKKLDEEFIFVNNDIEYAPYLYAQLLIEAIKAHGECPISILEKIMSSSVKGKLEGLAKLEFSDDKEVEDFMMFLTTLCGLDDYSEKLIYEIGNKNPTLNKEAQHSSNPYINMSDTWWFLGLIEKMLEPARGADWSTYKSLNPYFEELWDKIDKERAKRGREGLTYEALLRIKDGERDPDRNLVLEKELSSCRVW